MKGLTPKQRLFVTEYTKDLNATAAARRAGYSKKTADRIGPELLGKTGVAGAIAVKTAAQLARAEITAQDVVNELACIARSKASWFVDERGNLIEPAKLSPEAAAALVGWDVVRRNITSGDGQTDDVIRLSAGTRSRRSSSWRSASGCWTNARRSRSWAPSSRSF